MGENDRILVSMTYDRIYWRRARNRDVSPLNVDFAHT